MDDIRGIELIGEMTKTQLIDEIQAHNRKLLMETELAELKGMVIRSRVTLYQKRLEAEARIHIHDSLFGQHVHDTEDD